jgi:BirA family biotin operon repressor/biotin-[acetyl-CoA-carboxylase] ligase
MEHASPTERVPFARTLVERGTIASTNDLARELVIAGEVALPLVVWAKRQTAGRGRGQNAWWSDEGSLTFTIAIDPKMHGLLTEHEPRMALATAVALIDALAPVLPARALGIRWPNDIETGGRKLGGILPERIDTAAGPRLLIGVGLNVRTRLTEAPPDVARLATSVEAVGGEPMAEEQIGAILRAILARFPTALSALARDDPELAEQWNQLDTLAGLPVRIVQGERELRGLGAGIDAKGGLRLAGAGETITVYGGHVPRDRAHGAAG